MSDQILSLSKEDLDGYQILRNPETGAPEWVVLPVTVWRRVPATVRRDAKRAGLYISQELGGAFLRWPGFVAAYEAIEDAIDSELTETGDAEIERDRGARIRRGAEPTIPAEIVRAEIAGAHPIAAWRKHRGMTQVDLAAKVGIDRGYLAQLERGGRGGTPDTIARIAGALGCLIEDLLATA
jgi:DNA-binding XRE family transcriptional regulator